MTENDNIEKILRPQTFDDFIGNQDAINKLKIAIQAARERDEPCDHIIFNAPPGTGKTTLAHIIANESGVDFQAVMCPAIENAADLLGFFTRAKRNSIIFLDECHNLQPKMCEYLYMAMEDYKIDMKITSRKFTRLNLQKFCLIGATTRFGKLPPPMRDRFGHIIALNSYSEDEIKTILGANAAKLELNISEDALINLSKRCRGIPRIANRLLKRCRDFAQVNGIAMIDENTVDDSMTIEGIDEIGLTQDDDKYLTTLFGVYDGGPVGIDPLVMSMNIDKQTIAEHIEPFLISSGLISRTKQGRILTEKGVGIINAANRYIYD